MASQFTDADVPALERLLALVDAFWREPKVKLAAEIRQTEAHFGLTPLDRMRLQWKIEPEGPKRADVRLEPGEDPRSLLRSVK